MLRPCVDPSATALLSERPHTVMCGGTDGDQRLPFYAVDSMIMYQSTTVTRAEERERERQSERRAGVTSVRGTARQRGGMAKRCELVWACA